MVVVGARSFARPVPSPPAGRARRRRRHPLGHRQLAVHGRQAERARRDRRQHGAGSLPRDLQPRLADGGDIHRPLPAGGSERRLSERPRPRTPPPVPVHARHRDVPERDRGMRVRAIRDLRGRRRARLRERERRDRPAARGPGVRAGARRGVFAPTGRAARRHLHDRHRRADPGLGATTRAGGRHGRELGPLLRGLRRRPSGRAAGAGAWDPLPAAADAGESGALRRHARRPDAVRPLFRGHQRARRRRRQHSGRSRDARRDDPIHSQRGDRRRLLRKRHTRSRRGVRRRQPR